jgi:hypothetical protein
MLKGCLIGTAHIEHTLSTHSTRSRRLSGPRGYSSGLFFFWWHYTGYLPGWVASYGRVRPRRLDTVGPKLYTFPKQYKCADGISDILRLMLEEG